MNKQHARYTSALIWLLTATNTMVAHLATLDPYKPYPLYHSRTEKYLLEKEKEFMRESAWTDATNDHAAIAIAVFAHNADTGRPINGVDLEGNRNDVPIGGMAGRMNVLAALFGPIPSGQTLIPTLARAKDAIFGSVGLLDAQGNIDDSLYVDPALEFGFFSNELRFREQGMAFTINARIFGDFGIGIHTSVASKKQTLQKTTDLTPNGPDTFHEISRDTVTNSLTNDFGDILKELDREFSQHCPATSIEELRFSLFWRHAYEINSTDDTEYWPDLLIIPFIETTASISPGRRKPVNHLFGLNFGNNQHTAVGFNTGIAFDFIETVELTGQVGYTHFFPRDIENMPVPTSRFQNILYPFITNVEVKPGASWFFSGKIGSHHFIDKVSMYFEYIMIEHKEDRISLKEANSDFVPHILEEKTCFKGKFANIAFTYDISPNINLGLVWQAPLSQRNIPKSSTLLFSFNLLF